MHFHINDTSDYHKYELNSLGWEITISQYLECKNNLLSKYFSRRETYGFCLFNFIKQFIPIDTALKIMEIGGGYGYLMRDFIDLNPELIVTMVDISNFLLEEQKRRINGKYIQFKNIDFFSLSDNELIHNDFIIMNEILGDLPSLCNLAIDDLQKNTTQEIVYFKDCINKYSLDVSDNDNINIGAMKAVERICQNKIKYAFFGEHSCESSVNEHYKDLVQISATGNPQRIILKGHEEYSIKFSYLEKIASFYDYRIYRGSYYDILPIAKDDRIVFIFKSNSINDEHEVIKHFIEDLFQYEYLLLIRN